MDKNTGLRWAIAPQMELHHDDDETEKNPGVDPQNPVVSDERLEILESTWLNQDFNQIYNNFDTQELAKYICEIYEICQ